MAGGKRKGAGRKPVNINIEELEKLCGLQCTDAELAAWFNISESTFARRKKEPAIAQAMERGKARGLLSLRRNMWALAGKGNPAANIFLAKNLLGYRDYFSNEHSGPNGGPIMIGPAPELGRLTNEDVKQLASLVGKAGFPGKG